MRDSSTSGPGGIVNVRKDICIVSRGELRWKTQHSQLGNWINSRNGREPWTRGGSTGKPGRLRACVRCIKGKEMYKDGITGAVWTGPTTARRDLCTPSPAGGQLRILGKMTAPSWRLISGAKPSTFQTKVCTWRMWRRTAA